jgi:hypothetical protein
MANWLREVALQQMRARHTNSRSLVSLPTVALVMSQQI